MKKVIPGGREKWHIKGREVLKQGSYGFSTRTCSEAEKCLKWDLEQKAHTTKGVMEHMPNCSY